MLRDTHEHPLLSACPGARCPRDLGELQDLGRTKSAESFHSPSVRTPGGVNNSTIAQLLPNASQSVMPKGLMFALQAGGTENQERGNVGNKLRYSAPRYPLVRVGKKHFLFM